MDTLHWDCCGIKIKIRFDEIMNVEFITGVIFITAYSC